MSGDHVADTLREVHHWILRRNMVSFVLLHFLIANHRLSDLFERLRMLRGNKTMVFSSHRFGRLTRSADLVGIALNYPFTCLMNIYFEIDLVSEFLTFGSLPFSVLCRYMENSSVIEKGTHTELLEQQGGYAKMYNMQASQFI